MKLADAPTASVEGTVDVVARLAEVERLLTDVGPELVPERLPGHAVGSVVRVLGRIERRAGGARLVLTQAAADAGAWKAAGCRSPEEWAAREHGSTLGEARGDLQASKRLAELPAARDAAGSGEMSKDAVRAVADGAAADPAAERALVEKARTGDLGAVRDAARRARTRADERSGRAAQRVYQRRGLKAWVELDGEGRGVWNVPPAYQTAFLAALEPYREEAFRLAREAGRRETPEALMADALQMLCLDVLADLGLPTPEGAGATAVPDENGAAGSPPRAPATGDGASPRPHTARPPGRPAPTAPEASASDTDRTPDPPPAPAPADRPTERRRGAGNRRAPAQVIVHVDHAALLRGHARDGEMCEIPGLGPIPVSLARVLAQHSVLRILVTGGDDVTVITSQRRYVPAPLRAALEARDRTCVVPGCHARHHLEIDHVHPFARGGPTELGNLARLCRFHHFLKTHCGWTLAGGPGAWELRPP